MTGSLKLSPIALALLASSASFAQQTESTDTKIETISVLGSKVSNRTATESTSPIDILDTEQLNKGGYTELGQSLQSIAPSFNFSRTQVSDGSDLFRPATLRGLQPDQTLVLINGKRRHTQAIFGLTGTVGAGAAGTDMNSIPMMALKNVEILRDGAAARYGSDAIAGVINLSLNDSTGVTTGFFQGSATGEGDGDTYAFGLNRGFDIGSEGGFVNLSLEYRDAEGTNRAERDTGGSSTIPAGELSDTVRWRQGNSDSEFTSLFFNAALPFGDKELYSFGGYSNRTAFGNGFYRDFNRAERNVPQVYPDGFLPRIDNEADDISFAVGFKGDINPDWSFDFSSVYGQNKYGYSSSNTINASYAAEYLANNPNASDEQIVENAGPNGGYSGGFRFDQWTTNFDLNGVIERGDAEPIYVSIGAEYRKENYEIVPGEVASYACGASNAASSFPSVIDSSVFADCGFQAYQGLRPDAANEADRSSHAIYIEAETLLNEYWLVSGALRYEDVSDSGDETIWKLATRYEVTEDLAVRAAASTGFRAPSLQQAGYSAFTTSLGGDGSLATSFTATAGSPFPSALGIDGLQLESSDNLNLGFAWDASNDLSITLDFYQIKIYDRINLGSFIGVDSEALENFPEANTALKASGAVQANFFSNSLDSTTKGIDLIASYTTEIAAGELEVTFAANKNETTIDKIHTPEGISEDIALDEQTQSFLTHGQPQERATLTFDYKKDEWSSLLRLNYFGKTEVSYFAGKHIVLPDFLSPTNHWQENSVVESAVLVDINFAYQINDNFDLSVGIDNLFDKTPNELGEDEVLNFITNGAMRYPLRALPYGFDGMTYYAKVNFSF
ncbi:TonB-dependent receptor plug domain-containing protein [Pseudoalteromonas luteoviolacea]|uniref:Ligand-gated channel protein n=1 Tax=Pseudoalteromonas luteoviolacea S4054 TaxID=1129367 RepID=A0A0F6AF81_9GAMM|nr:TonB-dependent receptor [Pseudoalteromonas luteoviolacea]AOT07990.1 ligand-gated channel protein [Pseudoalteromonas luteoviolacea]AOT12906.1 ligand-gated channel protein [Pseudoalteromonas luteoviolacea]AOT17819.1 ligand-gated channel protein [Pseudoalteromonas luteoviolacea]KKE84461.1 ligand-gated channel protein [Pseudoalteromonas luteoviolacea S4054]KZN71836.1 ligand-gated channel protein [Pseudoalteromonas luteoviolacea S4047-1]